MNKTLLSDHHHRTHYRHSLLPHHHHHRHHPLTTTSSVTPSTIQCTQFYTSRHHHHHHRSSKSVFFSSFTNSSTAQLCRQLKTMKKAKLAPHETSDRKKKDPPRTITASSSFSSDNTHRPVLLKRDSWTDPCLDQWLANSQHQAPGASLVVIRTAEEEVIGAYLSESLKSEPYYYGSGECFLYKSNHKNQLQVYPWTSANDFMIFSNHDFIAIGGGNGQVGLFLHADLQTGHTQPCATFDNETLTRNHYFDIIGLEIWGFGY
ncbi:hypothetical protein [Absidia glauca]|uniref:Oxidation resistance protein 1 n=1 Tax=Absidia glauca TaxID=4829 RepID=A0A168PJW7_ABSGL|nr:hypothetical protein [Absidia glauca]